MGLDNPLHLAFLAIMLLLVFGAKRLPEMGRSLGAGLRGFRESIGGETGSSPQLSPPASRSGGTLPQSSGPSLRAGSPGTDRHAPDGGGAACTPRPSG
jgi:sec-independent protein translocase protein TatA